MWYSVVTAVAIPATFAIAAGAYDMDSASGTFHGLWQRINLSISLGWIAAVAVRYLRLLDVPASGPAIPVPRAGGSR
ncbi:hypothetical protein GCM10027059_08400 [Myceligenerans halotolerans]